MAAVSQSLTRTDGRLSLTARVFSQGLSLWRSDWIQRTRSCLSITVVCTTAQPSRCSPWPTQRSPATSLAIQTDTVCSRGGSSPRSQLLARTHAQSTQVNSWTVCAVGAVRPSCGHPLPEGACAACVQDSWEEEGTPSPWALFSRACVER